jgi:hypothetical protein
MSWANRCHEDRKRPPQTTLRPPSFAQMKLEQAEVVERLCQLRIVTSKRCLKDT